MDNVRWLPKGGDGADMASPGNSRDRRLMAAAVDAFKAMVTALANDDNDRASTVWAELCDNIGGEINPYGILACVGILYNSYLARSLSGDPHPIGQPIGYTEIMFHVVDADTGENVESEIHDVAIKAITYAANYEWGPLNSLMLEKIKEGEETSEFLHDFTACLMSIFIGMGGVDATGWC